MLRSRRRNRRDAALTPGHSQRMNEEAIPKTEKSFDEAADPMLKWFRYGHLPPDLMEVSRPFGELAWQLVADLDRSAERTVALRKLLEAKDAAVRARIEMTGA